MTWIGQAKVLQGVERKDNEVIFFLEAEERCPFHAPRDQPTIQNRLPTRLRASVFEVAAQIVSFILSPIISNDWDEELINQPP